MNEEEVVVVTDEDEGGSGIDYDYLANEFLKSKIEAMYAAANNPPIPKAKATNYLKSQIESYDPMAYKDRQWTQYESGEDFSKMRIKFN